MGIIIWLIVGGVCGWLASLIMRTDAQQGIILNIIVGIVGALIGGFIYRYFGHGTVDTLWSFIYALIGAVTLLLILRAFSGRRTVV